MVQMVTSVKNTFVHVDVDTPGGVEMGCNAQRRASSTPPRVKHDTAASEEDRARAFEAHGVEELLLLPHDDDDYTSMHAHPGPSPLDMDVERMLGCHELDADADDHYRGPLVSQAKDETTTDSTKLGTVSEELGDYSVSAPAHQCLTYGAQLQRDNYRESLAHNLHYFSTAPMTPHTPAQRLMLSTFPIPPPEAAHRDSWIPPPEAAQRDSWILAPEAAQRDSCMQAYSGNSPAGRLRNAKHEETQGDEKRTTVMLMNLPLRYTSSKLLRTIDSEGFAGMYDFIYVPMAAARNSKGYAFVNLVSPSIAQRFINVFDGHSRWSTASKNVGHAVFAKQHQGLQTNIDRYRNSTVLARSVPDEYKPRIFSNGVEIPFPLPSRKPSKSMPAAR